jgi:DNA-binding GntR family transcriptional regulator
MRDPKPDGRVRLDPLSRQVEQALREEILNGRLRQGEQISVEDVASRWGTSTTPARDAVKRLDAAGFLRVVPRRGVFVAAMDRERFRNVFELRTALECLAVKSAVGAIPAKDLGRARAEHRQAEQRFRRNGRTREFLRIDTRTHDLIIQHCGNQMLIEIMADLTDLVRWAQRVVVDMRPGALHDSWREHVTILEALQAREVEPAQRALRLHLDGVLSRTLRAFDERDNAGKGYHSAEPGEQGKSAR